MRGLSASFYIAAALSLLGAAIQNGGRIGPPDARRPQAVVRWTRAGEATRYCALSAGVLTVSGGRRVAIACRRGMLSDDLDWRRTWPRNALPSSTPTAAPGSSS